MNNKIESSELILNPDGSIYHLHLHPEDVADRVILVGDPGRVAVVASRFDKIEREVSNREFRSVTGQASGKRITVVSTGIGCDNIDIVMNELDALVNIDFATRTVKPQLKKLRIVRLGTCGGLQPDTPCGSIIASEVSIGFDGLLNFYGRRDAVCDLDFEKAFLSHMGWRGNQCIAHPYVVWANAGLIDEVARCDMKRGVTIACGGFYGPQGRSLRLELADSAQNDKIRNFSYGGRRVLNFEMESSAVAGLSLLMGHEAMTCCLVVANRYAHGADPDHTAGIEKLTSMVVDRI